MRIDAENKAASVQKFYSLQDIYKYLIGFDPNKEIEMELSHTYANPDILSLYNKNPKEQGLCIKNLDINIIKDLISKNK